MTVQVDSLVRALDIVDQTPPRDAALPAFGKAACCAVALVLETGEAMPARGLPEICQMLPGALPNALSKWHKVVILRWCGRRDSNPHRVSPKGF